MPPSEDAGGRRTPRLVRLVTMIHLGGQPHYEEEGRDLITVGDATKSSTFPTPTQCTDSPLGAATP